ncbi:hypothetical protein COP1_003635 [Malus domestica]
MVKEEPKSKKDTEQPSYTEQCEDESKSDAKPAAYKTNEKSAIPVKKKANPKSSLDKQPTLFSYFGKS